MTKEQIDLLLQRGHITPETANRMVQHYADGGVVAMPLKQEQPTLEQSVSEMSPIAGAGFGLVKNLFFDQRPPGEFEPGGGGITESMSPIDLITPGMVVAPAKALAPKLGQGLKALGKEVVKKASDPTGAVEVTLKKGAVAVPESLKSASMINREQFNEMVARGKLNQATGVAIPSEKLTKTPVGMGLVNQYSMDDIAHFYSRRAGGDPSAYDEFIADVARESQNKRLLKALPEQKAAPLPMDEASRMARAKGQGYNVDEPIYHGTTKEFTEFDPSKTSRKAMYGEGAYFSTNPEYAQEFAGKSGRVIKAFQSLKKPFDLNDADDAALSDLYKELKKVDKKASKDWFSDNYNAMTAVRDKLEPKQISDVLKKHGYDGLVNKQDGFVVIFDPSKIRSTEAAFDPKKIKSSDILAGVGGVGILGGASQAQAQEGKNMFSKEQADMMLQRGLITPQTYQRITGAQGYAEGGEVMPAPAPSPIPDIPVAPIDVNIGAPIPEALASAPMPAVPMAGPTPVPAMTPAGAAGVPIPGQYGPPSPMAQTPPATERAITPGVPGGVPAFQMPGEASMMKAAGLETQAAKQVADAAQASYDNLQAQLEKERNTYATIQNDIQGRLKTLDGEMMAGKVDPNRLWSEASTGAKIGAVIGMLFSGIGAGVTGKENMAIANLNKMIDRDVEAQKANIQNKQNLFSKYMAQLGDTRQAEAATRLHLLQGADVELKKAQAKAATPQAQAAFEKTKGELEKQKAAYTIELTKMMGNASLYGMGGSEGGIPFGRESFYQASDPELQKRIVPVADKQRSYLARTDAEAADLRKMEAAYTKARGMLNTLKQYSSLGSRISPSDRAKADALVAKLPPLLNELNGYARFTEMEAELLEKTFTSPGVLNAIFAPNTKTNALLKDLETQMQNKRAIMLQGYKPVTSFEPGAR